MNAAIDFDWQTICDVSDLQPMLGVRALLNGEQVAIFKVNATVYAIGAIDPFTGAAVLSRGIVGDLQGKLVVASPIYKQHFDLKTGICLEDESVKVRTYKVREQGGKVELAP